MNNCSMLTGGLQQWLSYCSCYYMSTEALLPLITRSGSSLAHRLYLEYYQFRGKEKQWNTYQLLNFYLEMAYVTSNNISLAKLSSMTTLKFKSIERYPWPIESSMPGCLGNSCPIIEAEKSDYLASLLGK